MLRKLSKSKRLEELELKYKVLEKIQSELFEECKWLTREVLLMKQVSITKDYILGDASNYILKGYEHVSWVKDKPLHIKIDKSKSKKSPTKRKKKR